MMTERAEPVEVRADRGDASRDAELVEALRDGSVEALATLFRCHGPGVHRLAFRITGSRTEAEDVVQDVFVGLRRALRSYEEEGRFGAWLRKVAARTALMRVRRKGRVERVEAVALDEVRGTVGVASGPGVVDRMTVRDALASLPEGQRRVFLLKEVEGYAHGEIAELLDITPSASRVRLHRAWSALREKVEEAS